MLHFRNYCDIIELHRRCYFLEFKDLVYRRRKELELTMEEVARKVGVSKATVQRWESGEIANIRRDKITLLAEALKTTPAYLMGWVDNDTSDIELSAHEKKIILAYRKNPHMQAAVDTLLNVDKDDDIIAKDIVKTVKATQDLLQPQKRDKK